MWKMSVLMVVTLIFLLTGCNTHKLNEETPMQDIQNNQKYNNNLNNGRDNVPNSYNNNGTITNPNNPTNPNDYNKNAVPRANDKDINTVGPNNSNGMSNPNDRVNPNDNINNQNTNR